jgi:transcriptional regulator with XRE-family HTH domain
MAEVKSTQYISRKLAEFRAKSGMTQSEVAALVGTNVNYYAKIERGVSTPSIKTFERIVKALGAKSSDILPY